MYSLLPFVLSWTVLLLQITRSIASPVQLEQQRRDLLGSDDYAPTKVACPSGSLVRAADGISGSESAYRSARYSLASTALASWLKKTNASFTTSGTLPTLGLTTSGGGYRSLLVGAGVIQGLDSRDSNSSVSGLLQAMTYQAGLSGGGWLLSSLIGNDYPTISYLRDNLWEEAFQDSLLVPANILAAPVAYAKIIDDLDDKEDAGYDPTLTDTWGRLLSYQLLQGTDGGVADTLSGVASSASFVNHSIPYPIITSLGVNTFEDECLPGLNATQYEFHPYEFGSWDAGVAAFTQTKYLGTAVNNGKANDTLCTANYDNLGYILGTSSTLFNEYCSVLPTASNSSTSDIYSFLAAMTEETHSLTVYDEYARYPNPFYNYAPSTLVNAQENLYLVDGGEAQQNNPLWPLIHPARDLDVIIVNDNSADTSANYPNGSEILNTYVQSITANLTRMPVIPSVDTFMAEGLNTRATFFGCNDTSKITMIFLPNYNFTYDSGVSTSQLQYSEAETDAMIADGNAVATQGGDKNWPTCLGCGIMKKTGTTLPSACTACFTKYCYN